MLIEFRVGNYRSFHRPQSLSLVASGDRKLPQNLIERDKFSLLKAAVIYGANASGKSNFLRALAFMRSFIADSATAMNLGDRINVAPFRLDKACLHEPSLFEVNVLLGGVRYQYGFTATEERVQDEWLMAFPRKKAQRWLERSFQPASGETEWAFRGPLRSAATLLRERTRPNGLVLSRGAELNVAALAELFGWFAGKIWPFDLSGDPAWLVQKTLGAMSDADWLRAGVMLLLRDADVGIQALRITEERLDTGRMPENLRRNMPREMLQNLGSKQFYTASTIRHRPGGDEEVEFQLDRDESNGTQRLIALAGPWIDALHSAALILVDELECSMHPLLTRKLVELFQSPDANRKGAQLIFATQDSTLMDLSILRRDQIWVTEKNTSGASELYSLHDYRRRPRNTEALQKNYLGGRYGGVPMLGAAFEDLRYE